MSDATGARSRQPGSPLDVERMAGHRSDENVPACANERRVRTRAGRGSERNILEDTANRQYPHWRRR